MRVIDLVPFSRSTWLLIFSVLAMLTVCEGVSGWYRYEVLPLLGRPGSIQHRCMTMAAALQQLVRAFTSANPEPMSPPEGDVGPRWNWEKAFTRQYDSVARANLKTLIADMKTSDIVCPRCEQVVSLATLNPGQVFEASLQLQELAAIIATTSRRSS